MSSRYAIIENKIVKNIVVCSEEEAKENGWVLAENAYIGDTYKNETFVRNGNDKPQDWETVRNIRNLLLQSTDWTVISSLEKGVDLSEDWKSYRQELRDITQKYTSPEDVIFPSQPSL